MDDNYSAPIGSDPTNKLYFHNVWANIDGFTAISMF